jgi:hypothetical protein
MTTEDIAIRDKVEKLFTIKGAATQLGLPYWKLNRATQLGLLPSYQLLNARKLVKLSEIVKALQVAPVYGDKK